MKYEKQCLLQNMMVIIEPLMIPLGMRIDVIVQCTALKTLYSDSLILEKQSSQVC